MATTIRVGHLAGARDVQELRTAISTAIVLSIGIALGIAAFLLTSAQGLVGVFVHHRCCGDCDGPVQILGTGLFYQISDAIQVVSSCALRGLKSYQTNLFYSPLSPTGRSALVLAQY